VEYPEPHFRPPYRVLVLIASTDGWYAADPSERERVTDDLRMLLRRAESDGARLLASFDDDLFLTGQPAPLRYSIFLMYDVDDLEVVVRLVHRLRAELGRYLRLEARVGRPLFVLGH
jgi:hypothetical protein